MLPEMPKPDLRGAKNTTFLPAVAKFRVGLVFTFKKPHLEWERIVL